MSFLLPLIALALAALCRFASRDREPLKWRFDGPRALALVVLVIVGAGVIGRYGPTVDRSGLQVGLIVGACVALLGELLGGSLAPIAVGVAGASVLHSLSLTMLPAAQLALLAGAGLGALAFGIDGALTACLAATLCASVDYLGAKHTDVAGAAFVGSELGLAAVVGALLAWWLPTRITVLRPALVGLATITVGYFATRNLNEEAMVVCTALGALAGVIVHWLLPDEEVDGLRFGLAAIIGVATATMAFGLSRGAGMGLALLAAAGVLLGVGNRRAFLTLGPLFGLVLYRVLREAGTGATRALDIGQHYALLGIILGAVLPLLPADWLKREGWRNAAGALLWGLIALATPALVILILGMKGAVGFVVGVGFSGLCQALRRERNLLPLALAGGLSGATILGMGWLAEADELTRDEKVRLFYQAGGAIVVIAILLALLAKPAKKIEVAS